MKLLFSSIFTLLAIVVMAQKPGNFNGMEMNMGNLYRLSNAETRSISPENFTAVTLSVVEGCSKLFSFGFIFN